MKAQLETELSESKKNDTPLLAKITRTSRQPENLFHLFFHLSVF